MKLVIHILIMVVAVPAALYGQEILELKPNQSMAIAGKGPGQNGVINPYKDQLSLAVVKNIGSNPFSVRIQQKGKILAQVEISLNETREFFLKPGFEIYFDTERATKVEVSFKKY